MSGHVQGDSLLCFLHDDHNGYSTISPLWLNVRLFSLWPPPLCVVTSLLIPYYPLLCDIWVRLRVSCMFACIGSISCFACGFLTVKFNSNSIYFMLHSIHHLVDRLVRKQKYLKQKTWPTDSHTPSTSLSRFLWAVVLAEIYRLSISLSTLQLFRDYTDTLLWQLRDLNCLVGLEPDPESPHRWTCLKSLILEACWWFFVFFWPTNQLKPNLRFGLFS